MATTPNSAPLTSGTTATAARYTVTPTSTAALGAAKSAIKQATGTSPPSSFNVGSTMSVAQSTPGGKFVQGSTTTPLANKAVSSSPAPKNTGTSQSNVLQSILGIAPLATVGLSVYNKVSQGVTFTSTISNFTNAVSSLFSVKSDQAPAETARLARQNETVTPATVSTNNVTDPAQRAQAAQNAIANADNTAPTQVSTFQDPAQRQQIADTAATNAAQNVGTLQDPAQRQQAAIENADNTAPSQVSTFSDPAQRQQAAIVNADNESPAQVSTFNDPAQRAAQQQEIAKETPVNPSAFEDPAQRQQAAIVNADNESPAQVSTFEDPAQRRQANQDIVDTIKYDGGPAPVSPFNDPSQRAQAQQDAIAAETPATPSQFEDPAQRGQALQEAIENPGPVSPSNVVDPAQRQQNVIIESEVPSTPSQFEDPSQRGQRQQEEIQNSAPAANPMGQDPAQRGQAQQEEIQNSAPAANPMGQDPAQRAQAAAQVESTNPDQGGASSNKTALRNTQATQTEQTAQKFKAQEDWRVRLSLAPGATYLYKVGQGAAGILNPLQATDGVIFPYTPAISVVYSAGYDSTDVTHSNYKFFSYKNSNVDNVTITADFTAQDTAEAQYLLAVIHFFRSVTKMFYGKDPGPGPGVPPPLCYLNGLGSFQFDWHPLVINNFTYTLPTDVDYIRAMDTASRPGVNVGSGQAKGKPGENLMAQRMAGGGIQSGALAAPPQFKNDSGNKDAVTYVPTKMSITIQAYPIVSRNDVSNNFSLKEYATGKLLRGSQRQSGGFW